MLLISHRGAQDFGPENSWQAFRHALHNDKYAALEVDIRTSKDGVLYVFHDKSLNRTTNMRGLLKMRTSNQLRSCILKNGEQIMSLETFLERISHYNKHKKKLLFLDIKDNGYEQEVFLLLQKYCLESDVLIGHVHVAQAKIWKSISKSIKIGLQILTKRGVDKACVLGCYSVAMPLSLTRKNVVLYAQSKGLKVFPFVTPITLSQKSAVRKAYRLGVDGIFINHI